MDESSPSDAPLREAAVREAALGEALRLSEERADLALDAAGAGVFDCDFETGLLYGSPRFRAMFGLPDGPIDVHATIALMHPDDREGAFRPWSLPEVNGRIAWNARARPVGSTEWRSIETRARLLRDAHGRALRMIGIAQDVTDAVGQLDALRESEWRLAQAQRIASIGSWSWDVATKRIIWTDELFRIFDVERRGRAGPTLEEYNERLHPDDRPTLRALVDRAFADGSVFYLEHSIILRDGSLRRVRSHGGAFRDERGVIVQLVGTSQDMTEPWTLAERVRRSEARYALAVQGTSDGVWQFDMRSRVTEVSPRLLELLGRPHDAPWVSSDWVAHVVPENDLSLLKDAVTRHLQQDAPLDLELQLRTESRGVRWFRIRGGAVRDSDGQPILLAGSMSDVTEHRALQTRIQHDSRMNALGTLAGGIAHDFNNLLAAILGYAQLASDEVPASSAAASHLQQVTDAALRARTIVREILAFSRPDEPRRSAVDVAQLAEETIRLLHPTLPSGVRLRVADAATPRIVFGDAVQLQRVLLNLCANSVHAVRGRDGEIVLHIATESLDEHTAPAHGLVPGSYVRVQVTDNGVGIASDVLPRVFEPFFTTKPVDEGTGLGLSVVHGIVVAAGGSVAVESVQHVGTTVIVRFPQLDVRAARSAGAAGSASDAHVAGSVLAAGASGRRVLVVDDDVAVGRLLQMALQRADYDVTLFSAPGEALEALASRALQCDCIVTDFAMPEMNGIEMLVRARAAGVAVPAIMVTGYADGVSLEMRDRAQVNTMVEKPIELRALVELVHAALATG